MLLLPHRERPLSLQAAAGGEQVGELGSGEVAWVGCPHPRPPAAGHTPWLLPSAPFPILTQQGWGVGAREGSLCQGTGGGGGGHGQ